MIRTENMNQKLAIEYCGDKPLLIEAGPGAGKTFVLIERVKFLIKECHVKPESLLVITFTNKAADELRVRLGGDPDIGFDMINQMQISTIHSFCSKLLGDYGVSGLNVLGDDNDEKLNMFIRKHKADLGFTYESYIPNHEIDAVIGKFEEFSVFDVDTDGLLEYLMREFPVSNRYLDLIREAQVECGGFFKFPRDAVRNDKSEVDNYKDSWFNAKYLSIVKAYPVYLELLEREGCADFNLLQIKALNLLRDESVKGVIPYRNVLIDEFQDTDPIQMQIFEELMKDCDSFTVVGDEDQSIYGFRGSVPEFFNEFHSNYDSDKVSLDVNYRSTPGIVRFINGFIRDNREDDSCKSLVANRSMDSDVFCLINSGKKNQADNIARIIRFLKDSGRVNNYCDVGVLFRAISSVKSSKIEDVYTSLDEYDIPFNGIPNLIDQDEVKSIILLLWYTCKYHSKTILTGWEKDWLNLKAFNGEFFDFSNVIDLKESTCNVLSKIEEDYQSSVVKAQNKVASEVEGVSKRKKYHTVFKDDDVVKEKVFKLVSKVDISSMDREGLEGLGITDEDDLNFFLTLNQIKSEFYNQECDLEDRSSILDVYYKLLNVNGFLTKLFNLNIESVRYNIASLTSIIYNYENILNKFDLDGLFWYLNGNLDNYACPREGYVNDDGVNILTIHKSKGLEFPVVIIGSFEEDVFPRKYDIEKIKSKRRGILPNYYTPNKFFKYKNHKPELDEKIYKDEENRTIYVAMTRAKDQLILSSIPHKKNKEETIITPTIIQDIINNNPDLKQLDPENLNVLTKCPQRPLPEKEEIVNLSYTHYANYDNCPHKYNLVFNYGFHLSTGTSMTYGTIAHNILNHLNIKKRQAPVSTHDVIEEIQTTIKNNKHLGLNKEDINQIKKDIIAYWEKYGKNYTVIGSEIPFNISKENYNLKGQIDLITQNPDKSINIIDYKNSNAENVYKYPEDYVKQLNIYYNAVKSDPELKDYEISSINIFALKSNELIPMEIDLDEINEINNKIETIAKKIINKEFPKNTANCKWCDFKNICN
jgi:DNA helicase-2/ATP-dependent DNA helicase PcrA